MAVTGFTVFELYRAVQLHFTTDHYDMLTHEGRVRGVTQDAFNKDSHKEFYGRFSGNFDTRDDLMDYLCANFAYRNKKGFMYDKKSDSFAFCNEWVGRKENITEVFAGDLKKILEEYRKKDGSVGIFTEHTELPVLLELFFEHEIAIETLRIIEDIHPYLHNWEKDEAVKVVCKDIIRIIKKLKKLVKYDRKRIREAWDEFMENVEQGAPT